MLETLIVPDHHPLYENPNAIFTCRTRTPPPTAWIDFEDVTSCGAARLIVQLGV